MTDSDLLQLCGLPADAPAEALELLRLSATLLDHSEHHAYERDAAAVTLAAAMGQAGPWSVRSLPFGYSGPRVDHEGWIKRPDLERALTQLGGLIVGEAFDARAAAYAVSQAVQSHWLREERYNAWRPGMNRGSGWTAIVQPQPLGLVRARELAAAPPKLSRATPSPSPAAKWPGSAPTPAKPSALAADGDDAPGQPPALTQAEQLALRTLAGFDPSILASVRQVVEAMDPAEAVSERTVTPALRKLVELDLAERPEGERRGTRLTLKGRRLAAKMPTIAD